MSALELRDEISRFYYEKHYYINKDTFYACMNTIKPWINMSILVTYLMKHGLVCNSDEMNKVTSNFLDGTTKLNNLLKLTESNGGRDGYFILYKCFCESREEVPLGHGDVIDELERHAAANPKIPDWLEQSGQMSTSWNPNSLPSHWTTGTDEQGGQSLRSQDVFQGTSNDPHSQAPHPTQAGPHNPQHSQTSQVNRSADSGTPARPIQETSGLHVNTVDGSTEALTHVPRSDGSVILSRRQPETVTSRFQGEDAERDTPGQGQTQLAASDQQRENERSHIEEEPSAASDSLSTFDQQDSVAIFPDAIQNTSHPVPGDDMPQGQNVTNQTQAPPESLPQQQPRTKLESRQTPQAHAKAQSQQSPTSQTQLPQPSTPPDFLPPIVHQSPHSSPGSHPRATNDERPGCVDKSVQIGSVRSLVASGDVHKLCTQHKETMDVECVSAEDCSNKASFMSEVSKFVCAVLNSRNCCRLGVLLGGVSYNTDKRKYEVVGIPMCEDELSRVKDRLFKVLSLCVTCVSSGDKVASLDDLVQFDCLKVQTPKGVQTVTVLYVTPKWELCKGAVYQHCCPNQPNNASRCHCRVQGTTVTVKPHDMQELESKLKKLWESQDHH